MGATGGGPARARVGRDVTSDDSARRLDIGTLESSGDPEVDRIRAVLEMRMGLGGVAPASRVGRFMVLDRVGAGAMGVVYRAYDDSLDRPVAIKVLHAELDSPSLRTRLFREARSMARLSNTNVATVFEVGEHRGRAFVAMELIRGRTLRQWQCEAAPSWREILRAYRQVAAGLAAATVRTSCTATSSPTMR